MSHALYRSSSRCTKIDLKKYKRIFLRSYDFWHTQLYFSNYLLVLNFQKNIGFPRLKNHLDYVKNRQRPHMASKIKKNCAFWVVIEWVSLIEFCMTISKFHCNMISQVSNCIGKIENRKSDYEILNIELRRSLQLLMIIELDQFEVRNMENQVSTWIHHRRINLESV